MTIGANGTPSASIVLFGATGMVGSQALEAALSDERIGTVTSIGRRKTGIEHAKLAEIVHQDYLAYDSLKPVLASADACIFCLAVYRSQVSRKDYEVITVDYPKALIGTLEQVNPGIRFILHGAAGADPAGKSAVTFARIKGRAEAALVSSALGKRHVFRPGLIVPPPMRRGWWWPAGPLRVVFRVVPRLGIEASHLGAAMVEVALSGHPATIIENAAARQLVGS